MSHFTDLLVQFVREKKSPQEFFKAVSELQYHYYVEFNALIEGKSVIEYIALHASVEWLKVFLSEKTLNHINPIALLLAYYSLSQLKENAGRKDITDIELESKINQICKGIKLNEVLQELLKGDLEKVIRHNSTGQPESLQIFLFGYMTHARYNGDWIAKKLIEQTPFAKKITETVAVFFAGTEEKSAKALEFLITLPSYAQRFAEDKVFEYYHETLVQPKSSLEQHTGAAWQCVIQPCGREAKTDFVKATVVKGAVEKVRGTWWSGLQDVQRFNVQREEVKRQDGHADSLVASFTQMQTAFAKMQEAMKRLENYRSQKYALKPKSTAAQKDGEKHESEARPSSSTPTTDAQHDTQPQSRLVI